MCTGEVYVCEHLCERVSVRVPLGDTESELVPLPPHCGQDQSSSMRPLQSDDLSSLTLLLEVVCS